MQCVDLFIRVEIIGNNIAVEGELDCVQLKIAPNIHGEKNRYLSIGGEQQLLLEKEQVSIQIEYFLLERLDILIETAEFTAGIVPGFLSY